MKWLAGYFIRSATDLTRSTEPVFYCAPWKKLVHFDCRIPANTTSSQEALSCISPQAIITCPQVSNFLTAQSANLLSRVITYQGLVWTRLSRLFCLSAAPLNLAGAKLQLRKNRIRWRDKFEFHYRYLNIHDILLFFGKFTTREKGVSQKLN